MARGAADIDKAAVVGMACLRIFLGLFFLLAAIAKVCPPAEMPVTSAPAENIFSPDAFIDELAVATGPHGDFSSPDNALPAYARFLRETVHPNAQQFGQLLIIGEAAVGILLLIGFLTRVAAGVAILISIAYLLATMHLFPPVGLAANAAFLVMEGVVLASNAGHVAGLDGRLGKKNPPKKRI